MDEIGRLQAELARARERETVLREALEFYADLNAYYDEYGHTDFAVGDGGQRAREALAHAEVSK